VSGASGRRNAAQTEPTTSSPSIAIQRRDSTIDERGPDALGVPNLFHLGTRLLVVHCEYIPAVSIENAKTRWQLEVTEPELPPRSASQRLGSNLCAQVVAANEAQPVGDLVPAGWLAAGDDRGLRQRRPDALFSMWPGKPKAQNLARDNPLALISIAIVPAAISPARACSGSSLAPSG